MADWIDELVAWQIQQGIRSGEYKPPPKPPAASTATWTASRAVVAALRPEIPWWLVSFRRVLMLRRR
ncbi:MULTISPECIES: hypothetical protein [Nocardia]|uniref:hypothetical protein n=1 Tax=Nocardia TaxID=1817 RepID=UPI002455C83A|nr:MULTISPECIES: hypothetical protein [Nocardia]